MEKINSRNSNRSTFQELMSRKIPHWRATWWPGPARYVSTRFPPMLSMCNLVRLLTSSCFIRAWSHAHRRTGAQFYLRSIVYKKAETIPAAATIYMLTTWRHSEIILIAKSNSPASQGLSLPAKEGQGHEEREIHFDWFVGRRVSKDDNFGIYIIYAKDIIETKYKAWLQLIP